MVKCYCRVRIIMESVKMRPGYRYQGRWGDYGRCYEEAGEYRGQKAQWRPAQTRPVHLCCTRRGAVLQSRGCGGGRIATAEVTLHLGTVIQHNTMLKKD